MRTRNLSLPLRSLVLITYLIVWNNIVSLGVQPLQDIEEVNMFKDDNTVVHFKKPLSKPYLVLRPRNPNFFFFEI